MSLRSQINKALNPSIGSGCDDQRSSNVSEKYYTFDARQYVTLLRQRDVNPVMIVQDSDDSKSRLSNYLANLFHDSSDSNEVSRNLRDQYKQSCY